MPLSLYVASTLRVEPQSGFRDVVAFLRGGASCALGQVEQAKAVTLLERHAASVIALRQDSPDRRLLGSVCVLEARTASGANLLSGHPDNLDVFLIGGLRVADDACGFDQDIPTRLIQEAITFLATADSDREGADSNPSCVAMITPTADSNMRARMRGLGAVRIGSPPSWLQSAAAMFGEVGQQEPWWITSATARGAATALLERPDITVTKRLDRSGRIRCMGIALETGWLTTANPSLRALAEGRFALNWVAPPSATPFIVESEPLRARRYEDDVRRISALDVPG